MELFTLPSTEEEAVMFLQEKGVLPKQRKCPVSSDHDMRMLFNESVGFHWACTRKSCGNKRISIRDGTWFSRSSVSLVKTLRFFYGWSVELTSGRWCKEQLGMNKTTTTDWNKCIRDVVSKDLDPYRKIGGEGLIVEVDENVIRDLKSNAGKVPPPQWIVGGICIETRQCFLKTLPDRNASAFLDIIRENVAEGSTIYCDSWKAYKTSDLKAAGFQHLAESHRFNFVDATTAEHPKAIEIIWESLKSRHKRQKGSVRRYLDSYLDEFIWRQEIGDTHPFEALLEAIKRCSNEVVRQQGRAVESLPEVCPVCEIHLKNATDLLMHANEIHDLDGVVKQEQFPSFSAFERWKEEMEEEHSTHWVRKSWGTQHKVFYGQLRCPGPRCNKKRKPNPSAKPVQRSCTSFINVKRYLTSDVTCVEYCLQHFGHEEEPEKPRLPWSVKLEIAEMLKQGLPVVEIVRILQQENDGTLRQQYSVTVQDVMSIVTKLKAHPEMFETRGNGSEEVSFGAEPSSAESSMDVGYCKQEPGSTAPSAFKIEPCSSESSMHNASIKVEPRSAPFSPFTTESTTLYEGSTSVETSIKQEPDTVDTPSAYKIQSSSTESPMPETSTKEEPISAVTLLAEPSAQLQTALLEVKTPSSDEIPVFTLTTEPDGKGFALVNHSPCKVSRKDVS